MFRPHQQNAQAQMVRCDKCYEPMNAVYSKAARERCQPCGGEAKKDSSRNRRQLTREKHKEARAI